jgi:hypothetical protein
MLYVSQVSVATTMRSACYERTFPSTEIEVDLFYNNTGFIWLLSPGPPCFAISGLL